MALRPIAKCFVANGQVANFWFDHWNDLGPLIDFVGVDGPRKLGINITSTVVDAHWLDSSFFENSYSCSRSFAKHSYGNRSSIVFSWPRLLLLVHKGHIHCWFFCKTNTETATPFNADATLVESHLVQRTYFQTCFHLLGISSRPPTGAFSSGFMGN